MRGLQGADFSSPSPPQKNPVFSPLSAFQPTSCFSGGRICPSFPPLFPPPLLCWRLPRTFPALEREEEEDLGGGWGSWGVKMRIWGLLGQSGHLGKLGGGGGDKQRRLLGEID